MARKRSTSSKDCNDTESLSSASTVDIHLLVSKYNDDIVKSMELNDILMIAKLIIVYDYLTDQYPTIFTDYMGKLTPDALVSMTSRINVWKEQIQTGDSVEVFSKLENKWFMSKVIDREITKGEDGSDRTMLLVHYLGWHTKYDQYIDLHDAIITPVGTNCKSTVRGKSVARNVGTYEYVVVDETAAAAAAVEEDTSAIIAVAGRLIRNKNNSIANADKTNNSSSSSSSSSRRQKNKEASEDVEEPDNNDWVCSLCHLLESADETELILCDGPCMRSFHLGCLKKKKIVEGSWFCRDCLDGMHACFICSIQGKDDVDVYKCTLGICGKYYHYNCLTAVESSYIIPKTAWTKKNITTQDELKRKKGESSVSSSSSSSSSGSAGSNTSEVVDTLKFKCPKHCCDTCFAFYGDNGKNNKLYNCLYCPRAFHINCIRPGSRYNSMCLLCPDHPNDSLPSKNVVNVSSTSLSTNPESQVWEQLLIPDEFPKADDVLGHHYRLPMQFKEDIQSGPPNFTTISSLSFDTLPMKQKGLPIHECNVICLCTGQCGSSCLNRVSKIECSTDSSNCNAGGNCGNKLFKNKTYSKYERFREHAMGWGLKAAEDISEGALIIEYIGEVISESEMRLRMCNQRKFTPSDHDFYIMELDNGIYVDGKHKGNESRFINHSCDPNCELERWLVNGQLRIGIFAIKSIKVGDALSYDYQFDTNEAEHFKCYCGSDNCRGTMAPLKKGDKNRLTKSDRVRLIAAGKAREKSQKEKVYDDEWTRSYTGKYLPGDNLNEVSRGPMQNTFSIARSRRVFLPRNTRCAGDFRKRRKSITVTATTSNADADSAAMTATMSTASR